MLPYCSNRVTHYVGLSTILFTSVYQPLLSDLSPQFCVNIFDLNLKNLRPRIQIFGEMSSSTRAKTMCNLTTRTWRTYFCLLWIYFHIFTMNRVFGVSLFGPSSFGLFGVLAQTHAPEKKGRRSEKELHSSGVHQEKLGRWLPALTFGPKILFQSHV